MRNAIRLHKARNERENLLSAMRRRFDWTGKPPKDEDVERVYWLDKEILEGGFS